MPTDRTSRLTALVTGASTGIGLALAECFAAGGYDLILTARSLAPLTALCDRLTKAYAVTATPIALDLAALGGSERLVAEVARLGLSVDVLVNNAGFGQAGEFAGSAAEIQLGMIDLNVRALVELTHQVWPAMLASGRGGILNVSSTSAFQPGPGMAIYFASKAFVLSFSEALWSEAQGTGVHVSCLCPGPTASEFRKRAGTDKTKLSLNPVMSAAEVAQIAFDGFRANQRVVIPGARNRIMASLIPFVPRSTVLTMVRTMMGPVRDRA